jgi:hypothetical protein
MQGKQTSPKKRGRPPRNPDEGPIRTYGWRVGGRERFALKLLSRQKNTDEAVLLEQLISASANEDLTASVLGKHWLELYDTEPGVAALRCFALPRYRPSPKEERIKAFVLAHAPFFYSDEERQVPYRERVVVLWKNEKTIASYAESWFRTRADDVWGVAKVMAADLKRAGASVPAGRGKW